MSATARFSVAGIVLVMAGFVGCGDDTAAPVAVRGGCSINTDCADPLVCVFSQCHNQCEETRDCPVGERCVVGNPPTNICQSPEQSNCTYNSECAGEQVCAIDGQCRDQCAADRDCVRNQICATGTCADTEELIEGALPVKSGETQVTGQPCAYTSECSDGLVCREGLCNLECLGDADCSPFPCDLETNRCVVPEGRVVYCIPGTQAQCGCPNGQDAAIQVCLPDGSGFDSCQCG